jgi:hypothetical protein
MNEEMVVAIGEGKEQRSRAAAGRRKRSVIRIQELFWCWESSILRNRKTGQI